MASESLPGWLHGCIVYSSPYAGPGPAAVFDCSVGDSAAPRRVLLDELVSLASRLLGRRLAVAGYEVEDMRRLGYRVNKAMLSGGGEARIVEYLGRLLNAVLVLPGEAAVERVEVGSPLHPPVPGSPSGGREQPLLERPPVYTAEPLVPEHPGEITVRHSGGEARVALESLLDHLEEVELPLHCVTGWSTLKRWIAAPLAALLSAAGAGPPRGWLVAVSTGGYAAVIPASEAREAWLAVGLEGRPLPRRHGGPVRLVAPSLYGWKHVKWVARIDVVDDYVDGFWEARGYHEAGRAAAGERFKVRNPGLLAA